MARVVSCSACGAKFNLKIVQAGPFHFCSEACKGKFWREHDRETTWLLMELTRQLWDFRAAEVAFRPRDLPPPKEYRINFNRMAEWIRGIVDDGRATARTESTS